MAWSGPENCWSLATQSPSALHGEIGRRLLSVSVNLLVSKFRIAPPPFECATRPKCNQVNQVAGEPSCKLPRKRVRLFDFIVDASDERRRQRNAKRSSSGGID
jgi:hypothetical protein